MDILQDTTQFLDAKRRDGWTPLVKARFLALLAENGNVRHSARCCGLSAQSAYVQRRRDALFARGWAAALMLARDHAAQVLAERAIQGIEEEIYYRGELIATRRKYDSRLLLAHLARLDRMAEEQVGGEEAERFDELLALVAGEQPPEGLDPVDEDDILPATREAHADLAAARAEWTVRLELDEPEEDEEDEFAGLMLPGHGEESEEDDPPDLRDAAICEAGAAARSGAAAQWDEWFGRACWLADALTRDLRPASEQAADDPNHSPIALSLSNGVGASLLRQAEGEPNASGTSPADIADGMAGAGGPELLPLDSVNLSTSLPALPPHSDIGR